MHIFLSDSYLCAPSGNNSFLIRVVTTSCIPVVIALLILFVYLARQRMPNLTPSLRAKIASQHAWAFLFLTYLVLPACSMIQFQALECKTLDRTSGRSFLRVDSSIDCDSQAYKRYRLAIFLFIFVYQSFPVFWLILLRRSSKRLNIVFSGADSLEEVLEKRKNDNEIGYLSFLWSDYMPRFYYFEV